MFSPSPFILTNRVDVYKATNAQDADGGYTPTYAAYRLGVPCSVQFDSVSEVETPEMTASRITEEHAYTVIFGTSLGLNPRDKLIWRDSGITHTLFVQGSENCGGRGAAFAVKAIERI